MVNEGTDVITHCSSVTEGQRRIYPNMESTTEAQGVPKSLKSLWTCYLLWLPPLGLLGLHQYYLHNYFFGVFYTFSGGGAGACWLIDLFRMPFLLKRENLRTENYSHRYYIDDTYMLHMPWGLIGLHHHYLGNYWMGVAWLITFGCFGFGWLLDLCRIPDYVKEANMAAEKDKRKTDILGPPPSYAEHTKYPLRTQSIQGSGGAYWNSQCSQQTLESTVGSMSSSLQSTVNLTLSASGQHKDDVTVEPLPPSYDDVISRGRTHYPEINKMTLTEDVENNLEENS